MAFNVSVYVLLISLPGELCLENEYNFFFNIYKYVRYYIILVNIENQSLI